MATTPAQPSAPPGQPAPGQPALTPAAAAAQRAPAPAAAQPVAASSPPITLGPALSRSPAAPTLAAPGGLAIARAIGPSAHTLAFAPTSLVPRPVVTAVAGTPAVRSLAAPAPVLRRTASGTQGKAPAPVPNWPVPPRLVPAALSRSGPSGRAASPAAPGIATPPSGQPATAVGSPRMATAAPATLATVAGPRPRLGIDEVFSHATGGLARALDLPAGGTPATATVPIMRDPSPTGATARPVVRRTAVPGDSPAGTAPAPRPVATTMTAPAPAPLARRIVSRMTDRSAAGPDRFAFERRRGASGAAARADHLQIGAVRLQSAAYAVAPVVLGRRADLTSGQPNGEAGRTSAPAPASAGGLLQRAQALFSTTSTASPAPPAVPGAVGTTRLPDPHHPRPGDPPIVRRLLTGAPSAGRTGGLTVTSPTNSVDQSPAVVDAETIEWIIEAVEERVLEELERRGLRYNPGVF